MEIGLGIDGRLALSAAEQADIAAEAAVLGYTSLWTTARDDDPFELCALWHRSSGLETGISVLPLQLWAADRLIAQARRATERTAGKFVLGVGAGRAALAKMVLGYAMNRPGGDATMGYRAHFARMGFDAVLTELEVLRDRGADAGALAERLPDELLARVGWWGRPEDAAAGF